MIFLTAYAILRYVLILLSSTYDSLNINWTRTIFLFLSTTYKQYAYNIQLNRLCLLRVLYHLWEWDALAHNKNEHAIWDNVTLKGSFVFRKLQYFTCLSRTSRHLMRMTSLNEVVNKIVTLRLPKLYCCCKFRWIYYINHDGVTYLTLSSNCNYVML